MIEERRYREDELPYWFDEFVAQGRDAWGWHSLYSSVDQQDAEDAMRAWMNHKPEYDHRVIRVRHEFTLVKQIETVKTEAT